MYFAQAAYVPGVEFAAGPRTIPDVVREWRQHHCVCAMCQLRIHPDVPLQSRGGKAFHPSCARKHDAQEAQTRTTVTAPQTIGKLAGIALPSFSEQCYIVKAQASERFAATAFDASIARGGQVLQLDHGVTIPGRLRVHSDNALRFAFDIYDSPIGRQVLGHAQRHELHGVSIAFRPTRERSGAYSENEILEATLVEISLCRDAQPSWFGTKVWLEA